MKIRITQLNFHKDPTYDPNNLIEDEFAQPYIIEYKRHWWNRWRYVMDEEWHQPKLLFGKDKLNAQLQAMCNQW